MSIWQSLTAIAGPTGGLAYHFTASRFSTQWNPFRENIRLWLQSWKPQEKNLLLFGPSAGYSLPIEFFRRFERIDIIEPDPVARALFKKRFAAIADRIHFETAYDVLPWWQTDEATSGEQLMAFLEGRERKLGASAILFANFLGQLPLLKTNHEDSRKREGFLAAMKGYTWASYHDLFSGRTVDLKSCPEMIMLSGDVEVLARRFFRNEAEVVDHATTWLGENSKVQVCRWQFTPKNVHVIAFVSANRT